MAAFGWRWAYAALGGLVAVTILPIGLLLDRISPRFLLCAMLGLLCGSLLLAVRVNSPELMLTYGVVLGLMQGSNRVLQAGVYAYYFGRSHLGSISGFATTLMVAGTAFGPLLFALGFEQFGRYAPTLTLALLAPLAVGTTALWFEVYSARMS